MVRLVVVRLGRRLELRFLLLLLEGEDVALMLLLVDYLMDQVIAVIAKLHRFVHSTSHATHGCRRVSAPITLLKDL